MLIGKGYHVSIYDREVSLARVYGSNRAYIEQTIPLHFNLLKTSLETALEGAEVVVVAKKSPEFEQGRRGTRSRASSSSISRALLATSADHKGL